MRFLSVFARFFPFYFRNTEWFAVYDKQHRRIGRAPREICHNGSMLLHRVVHLLIIDDSGRILLQKRHPDKKIQPGKWDTSVGGHIAFGEAPEEALVRETREELGFIPETGKIEFLHEYDMTSSVEKEWVATWKILYSGPFQFQKNEITEIRFFSDQEISGLSGSGDLTPNFEDEYTRYKEWLKK